MHLGEFLPPLIASVVYLYMYSKRRDRLAERGREPASWRAKLFICGVMTAALVQLPPFDGLADSVLMAHMVQHIVIGDLCSLMIVLGLTGPVLAPLLRTRLARTTRSLANPIVALALWASDLYAWHLPLFYQLAIRHDLVHALEHACLLWFGILLWLALIGPLPKPAWFNDSAKLVYVVAVRLLGAILANVFIWAHTVFYPVYRATDARRGLNPLSDQNLAGGIMMLEQIALTTALLGWLYSRFAKREEARQELLDLAAQRGRELTDARAGRAAAAGAAERMRDRIRGPAE